MNHVASVGGAEVVALRVYENVPKEPQAIWLWDIDDAGESQGSGKECSVMPESAFSLWVPDGSATPKPSCRVLVVESDVAEAHRVCEYLEGIGAITQMETLAEAVAQSREKVFDAALVDSVLADAEEEASIKKLIALGAFPVILLTGQESDDFGRKVASLGAHDYLIKGQFNPGQLRRAISAAVFRHEVAVQNRILIDESPDAIFMVDGDGVVISANRAASSMFGMAPERLLGTPLGIPLAANNGVEIDLHNGRVMEMRVSRAPWRGNTAYLAIFRDVTERSHLTARLSEATERYSQLSILDPLTGLLNRRGIEEVLHRIAQSTARGSGRSVAILFDCDDFKSINTVGGYAAGDATLQLIANILTQCMRAPLASIGRIGGDEFLALLTDTRFAESVLVAERLRDAISRSALPVSAEGITRVTVSIGVAAIPAGCSSLKEVITLAESALQASKTGGKDRVSVRRTYGELNSVPLSPVTRICDDASCITMAKQAILELSTQTVVGHELLFRGSAGNACDSPTSFFVAARKQNLLAAADFACIRRAMELYRKLELAGSIHLNIFPSTLLDMPVSEIVGVCQCRGATVLELSEQEFVGDPGLLLPALQTIREAGLRIALDDVGFGRSSLETMLVLEPEVIKIDRCLLHGIADNPALRRTTTRLLRCAHELGAEVIAEGVERAPDATVVHELGIHLVQGNLWHCPEVLTD